MRFEDYVAARGSALVRLAILLTGDYHRGEDLAQEVLAQAYVKWRRISRTDVPELYIRRMLVNANASYWRRTASHEIVTDKPPPTGLAGDAADLMAERDAIMSDLALLPVRQRAVVVLRYYEDLDDATIAQLLDCSVSTVRSHAMRAMVTLRHRLGVPAGKPTGFGKDAS